RRTRLPIVTRLAENTSQLKPMFAPSPSSMSPFLHDRIVLRPTKTPSPIRIPALVSPFASSRQLSSTTTLLPMWILCGWRRTTCWPKTTLRPHEPSSRGYSAFRRARPSAPGHDCANVTMSSYLSSAPRPRRPTTSAAYFADAEREGSKSCSCALPIDRPPERLVLLPSSDPAMLTVPVERSTDALAQADARRVSDLRPRACDVERAALREKVERPRIDGRMGSERPASRLAARAKRPERPYREVPRRRRDARAFRHQPHQLVQRRHFPARENVGAVRRRRVGAAQPEAFHEIVDERQMVIDLARTERHPPVPCDAAKQPQQPSIAGTINAGRPHDGDLDAPLRAGLPCKPLPSELRLLIDVARPQRRILVRGRVLTVAVNADRAAVHHTLHAVPRCRLDEMADCGRVHRAIDVRSEARLPIQGGDVIDNVDARRRFRQRGGIAQVANRHGHPRLLHRQRRRTFCAPDRRPLVAARHQCPGEVAARKAGRASD